MRGTERLGRVTDSTRAVAEDVLRYLEQRGTPLPDHPDTRSPVVWGMGTSSEHATGRALDFMVTGQPKIGHIIRDYLWANRSRLGVIHVIWRRTITSTKVSPGVVRPHGKDSWSSTDNHMDHVHVFLDGSAPSTIVPTPGTGTAGSAPGFPLPRGAYFGPRSGPRASVSGYYSHRADLRKWQARMRARGWRITPDGLYGGQTNSVARAFQAEKRLRVDGLIGPETWRAAWTEKIT